MNRPLAHGDRRAHDPLGLRQCAQQSRLGACPAHHCADRAADRDAPGHTDHGPCAQSEALGRNWRRRAFDRNGIAVHGSSL